MLFYGLLADTELVGDLFVLETGRDELENSGLPVGEPAPVRAATIDLATGIHRCPHPTPRIARPHVQSGQLQGSRT